MVYLVHVLSPRPVLADVVQTGVPGFVSRGS